MKGQQLNSTIKERAIAAINDNVPISTVAKTYGVHYTTVYRWIAQYNKHNTLERRHSPAVERPAKTGKLNLKKVMKIISKPASKFGYDSDFWTTPRLVQIAKSELGIKVSRMAIHRALKKVEYSYRKPEIRYYSKNKDAGLQEWRKKTVPKIRKILKDKTAILYFEDESNIQLVPVVAKTWGPVGEKITQNTSGNRGSVSAISAISKSGELIFNVFDGSKRFNSDDIIRFLSQMLKQPSLLTKFLEAQSEFGQHRFIRLYMQLKYSQ